jgi:isopentenyl-diphosphate Delta-isomerase
MDEEFVIVVDRNDIELGLMEKMEAHRKGVLHRAFSIFVFNEKKELMVQQRALTKYHSPGLWTNTCCSHPRQDEATEDAAHRRLVEEMGFDCELKKAFHFLYRSDVGDGLTEHEFDHVFIAVSNKQPAINKEEVHDWKYMSMEDLKNDILKNPDHYTVWFRIAFGEVESKIKNLFLP